MPQCRRGRLRGNELRDWATLAGEPGGQTRCVLVQLLAGLPEVFLELVDLSAEPLHFAIDGAFILLAVAKLSDFLFAFPGQAAGFRAKPGGKVCCIVDDSMTSRAQPAFGLLRLLLRIPGSSFELPLSSPGIDTQVLGRTTYLVR